jgi:FKBP-type peptidyl-prolyl cis-trans isomerase 2
MAERSPSIWVLTLAVLVILVAASVGGGYLYLQNHRAPAAGPRTVALGENVTVNYIGVFGSGPEKGRVFDTSILADARNNISWPKSLEYSFRSNLSQYTPLGVHVAPHTPSSGYSNHNVTFGGVVTGFWRGLLGLPGNVTRTITIPPALGYGSTNTSCLVTAPLVLHIPVVLSVSSGKFAADYPNVTLSPGVVFPDPTYHWNDLILSQNSTSVSVENLPLVGFVAHLAGWTATVTNTSNGMITVTNNIAPSQVGLLTGHSKGSVCSSNQYIVSAVDAGAGTYTEDYNKEVVGQTLVFIVTVVDIYH